MTVSTLPGEALDGRDLGAEARALGPWFHNLHLPDGSQTAPDHRLGDFPSFKWARIGAAIPTDLRWQLQEQRQMR